MLILFVVALLVASVWGIVLLRQFGLLGGCLSVLVIGSCCGHAFYHVNVGPLPVTADRLLLAVLLAVYALYRMRGWVAWKPIDQLDLVLLAFIGMLVISTLTHDWRAGGMRALSSLLFYYLMPLALYWIVRASPLSPRAVAGVLITLALFGCYLAVTSVLEQQRMWSFVFPRYIVSGTEAEFLGRGRGPFLNPVANGLFLCAGFFSLMMFWPRVGRYGKSLLLLVMLIYVAGIYCTLTRVVWLAAAAGLLVTFVLTLPRRWSVTCVVTATVLGVAVGVTKWDDLNAFKRDQNVTVADMSQSASLRPILAYVAWQMYLDRPLVGCGYRQYEAAADFYLSDRTTRLRLERARRYVQHNVFLSLLAETGMVGLGLFLILLATLARIAWQQWRATDSNLAGRQMGLLLLLLLLAYVTMAMFHDLTLIPMVHMLLLFLAGVTRALQPQCAVEIAGKGELMNRERASGGVSAGPCIAHE